jgi:hypothetical protein
VYGAEWWWRQWIRVETLNQRLDEGLEEREGGNRHCKREEEALEEGGSGAAPETTTPYMQHPKSNIQHPNHPPALNTHSP